jgi:CDP-glycerol glycerophosphotransferase (TagB/SpsB family)
MEKPVILFESIPDFTGSSLSLYNEFIRRGFDKKYDLLWTVSKTAKLNPKFRTVSLFKMENSNLIDNTIQNQNILKRTKLIIDSNRLIKKPSINSYRIHVRHGCAFKDCSKIYYKNVGELDAIITTSKEMKSIDQKFWASCVKDKFIITGLPSTDRLFKPTDLYSNGFIYELTKTNNKFTKIIGWLPTFRTGKSGIFAGKKFKFGIPILYNLEDLKEINEYLKQQNILLLIQIHHYQMKDFVVPELSNIIYITEQIKQKYNITTHDLMPAFDALITDYSAAYHEYILLDRQIGLTIDDLVEYSKTEGFCYNYLDWIKGKYILDKSDLLSFINNVITDNDTEKEKREQSLHKIHDFIDGNSTNRVIDYLIVNAKL